jgi:hypothetical protein
MLTKKVLTMLACAAWGGVLLSSAAPASAVAVSQTTGQYALCQTFYQAQTGEHCGYLLTFSQPIKFQSTACSTGTCNSTYAATYTDTVYTVGRKAAWYLSGCAGGWTAFNISSCNC